MLCGREKPGALLLILRRCSPKRFPQSMPSLADVNGRAATAGDAVNQTAGQASEGIFDGEAILWPQKIGFRWKYGHKYANLGVHMDKNLRVL